METGVVCAWRTSMGSYDITLMAGLWVTFRDVFRGTILFQLLFNVCQVHGFPSTSDRTKY